MITVVLPIIIIGLFILWYFFPLVGIIGLGLIILLYWILYFSGRKASRRKLEFFKDRIIQHFSVFGSKSGQEHYKYLYDNAHFYLMPMASRSFSSINSMITICCLIMAVISIFRKDWYSIVACILFYWLAALLSSKFNKPYFDQQAVKDQPMASFDINCDLDGYSNFFTKYWQIMLQKKIEKTEDEKH